VEGYLGRLIEGRKIRDKIIEDGDHRGGIREVGVR
jgi:hypothetical protein